MIDMNLGVIVCPACGAAVVPESEKCEFCGNGYSFVLKSGKYLVRKDIEMYLCNHFYELANEAITNLPVDSEINVYKAIITLNGKPAFLQSRKTIDQIVKYLDMALMMNKNADAAFVRAYIEYDYFERKCLNRKKPYTYYYDLSMEYGIDEERINVIQEMLNDRILRK